VAIGSTQPALTIDALKKITLAIPPIVEQKQITEIVSSLDEKIELNRKINTNLEKIASSLFKKWFVDIADELPEGWKMGKLSDLVDNVSDRYIGNNEEDNFPYVPIDMISPKSLSLSSVAKSEDAKSSLIKFLKDDILFGAMRPYFHKVSLAPFEGLTRTTCFILRPRNKNTLAFCTLLIFQEETVNFASSHSEGSTIPYAKWNNSLENMLVRIPPNEMLSKFNDIVYPILETMRDSFFENMNLITIRDSILPRLMNGKIRVSTT
jgi:type I restriction enzyme S subunit